MKHDKFSPLTISMLVILIVYCLILLFMLLFVVMQVFKMPKTYYTNPVWFPKLKEFTIVNFKALVAYTETTWVSKEAVNPSVSIVEVFINSISYSVGGAFINAAVTCLMAYLTARYSYFYSKVIYAIVIVVMVVPVVGAQASEIEVLKRINLWNTRFGFVVLKASFVSMYFLVFYETFRNIPMSYSEAAMLDGASDWYIMTKICLPLALNVFMTVALITFIQYWNDYQMPLLYMPDYPTLSYFLFKVQNTSQKLKIPGGLPAPYQMIDEISSNYVPIKMTATAVLMAPILVIFIALHERLMGNLSIGGIKG